MVSLPSQKLKGMTLSGLFTGMGVAVGDGVDVGTDRLGASKVGIGIVGAIVAVGDGEIDVG